MRLHISLDPPPPTMCSTKPSKPPAAQNKSSPFLKPLTSTNTHKPSSLMPQATSLQGYLDAYQLSQARRCWAQVVARNHVWPQTRAFEGRYPRTSCHSIPIEPKYYPRQQRRKRREGQSKRNRRGRPSESDAGNWEATRPKIQRTKIKPDLVALIAANEEKRALEAEKSRKYMMENSAKVAARHTPWPITSDYSLVVLLPRRKAPLIARERRKSKSGECDESGKSGEKDKAKT